MDFGEKGSWGERKTDRHRCERNIDGFSPLHALTEDQTHNLGMCPNPGLNLNSFGV